MQDGETGVVIANDADAERSFELLPLITRKARASQLGHDMDALRPLLVGIS